MTNQEVYDKILEHFSQPDAELAFGTITTYDDEFDRPQEDQGCVYRGDGDPKSPIRCAFGCVIPDEMYKTNMENVTASGVLNMPNQFDDLKEYFEGVDPTFLDTVQALHDNIAGRAEGDGTVAKFLDQLRRWPDGRDSISQESTNGELYDIKAP